MQPVRFGSSGIRGPYGSEVTPTLALKLGQALGERYPRVVVGRDARTSSPLLEHAAIAGLLSAGAHVTRVGVLPTPALAYAARDHDAGLMITASHNPAPDNGFKLWNPDGSAFDADQRKDMESRLASPTTRQAAWNELHTPQEDAGAIGRHQAAIRAYVGAPARPLRVVLDCGNGAACNETPTLLRSLGHHVITLNAQPDGSFPGRPSEPSETNLRHLARMVEVTGADVGIAHDGDADRCMAVTDRGAYVTGDALCALFAKHAGRDKIVVPVDASLAVEDAFDGTVVRTRVGDAYVSEAIAREGADWGGEASGAWIFPRVSSCPDGPLAAAVLCDLVAAHGSLHEQVTNLPRYALEREAHAVPADAKDALMERVATHLGNEGEVSTLDGVRLARPEGWLLVRPSGTEPKIRLTAEARDPQKVPELLRVGRQALEAAQREHPA